MPEESIAVTSYFYVGVYDSESSHCDASLSNGTDVPLQHAFSAGGSGGGWSYSSLMLVINPSGNENVDLTLPMSLSMTVSKHYAELSETSIRIAGIKTAPPDSLSYKSSGASKRADGQMSCPPDYVRKGREFPDFHHPTPFAFQLNASNPTQPNPIQPNPVCATDDRSQVPL